MDRSDWLTVWRMFHVWYKETVKATGFSPTWRKQQNKIHKLVTKAMHYRRSQPPVTGKRPVGRPRKHPVQHIPGPGPAPVRTFERSSEPLPTLPPVPGAQ